jgi:hypothetical protein
MGNEVYSAAVALGLGVLVGTRCSCRSWRSAIAAAGGSPGPILLWAAALVYFLAIWTYTLLPLPDAGLPCAGVNLDVWAFVDDPLGRSLTDFAVLQLALNVLLSSRSGSSSGAGWARHPRRVVDGAARAARHPASAPARHGLRRARLGARRRRCRVGVQVVLEYVVRDHAAVVDGSLAQLRRTWCRSRSGRVVLVDRTDGRRRRRRAALPRRPCRNRSPGLRFVGGIGGYLLLSLLPGGWAALSWVFAAASVIVMLRTRGAAGCRARSGQDVVDARGAPRRMPCLRNRRRSSTAPR